MKKDWESVTGGNLELLGREFVLGDYHERFGVTFEQFIEMRVQDTWEEWKDKRMIQEIGTSDKLYQAVLTPLPYILTSEEVKSEDKIILRIIKNRFRASQS